MLDGRNKPFWVDQGDRNCDFPPQWPACCDGSHLRDEGIKRTSTPNVYFADADLRCSGLCSGRDSEIEYQWSITPISGNPRIVGPPLRIGDNQVAVVGTGTFNLHVRVTFPCLVHGIPFRVYARCVREATITFTQ